MTDAGLVSFEVTTTAIHAERIVEESIDELRHLAVTMQAEQMEDTSREEFGMAVYTNYQIQKTLEAAARAKEKLKELTSQGETKHEND